MIAVFLRPVMQGDSRSGWWRAGGAGSGGSGKIRVGFTPLNVQIKSPADMMLSDSEHSRHTQESNLASVLQLNLKGLAGLRHRRRIIRLLSFTICQANWLRKQETLPRSRCTFTPATIRRALNIEAAHVLTQYRIRISAKRIPSQM